MTKIETIAQELENSQYTELVAAQNYPAIAALLNTRPLISNPDTQQNIPLPLNTINVYELITKAEVVTLFEKNLFSRLESLLGENNRDGLTLFIEVLRQVLSETSVLNIQTRLEEEIPDPSYQEQIPGQSRAEELAIYPVYDYEVQEALNPYIPMSEES